MRKQSENKELKGKQVKLKENQTYRQIICWGNQQKKVKESK
jgi:hypothetical protein